MITETYLDEHQHPISKYSSNVRYVLEEVFDEFGILKRSRLLKIEDRIQKAKVYVKNPQDAPQGVLSEK